ncbi:MAG: POTRA domain-containing protein [Acidobacteriota bacterium]
MSLPKQRELLCLLVAMAATAQAQEGLRLNSLRFSPPAQPVPEEELRQLLPLREGEPYSAFKLREALAVLYRTGRYTNLTALAETGPAGLDLTFQTEFQEFTGSVNVLGAPGSLSRGSLINVAKLPLGAPFEPGLLNQSIEDLESELRLEGFYESRIRFELLRDPPHQQVSIRFFIDAGPHARFGQPIFRGRPVLDPAQLIGATHWRRFFSPLGWKFISEQRVQSGLRGIQQAYRKRDLLMAKVQLERLDYQPALKVAIPNLRIDAGSKVLVRTTGIRIPNKTLRRLVPVFEEQSVDKDLLMEGERKITSFLHSKGFFDAKVSHQLQQGSQVDFQIDKGPRVKVGALYWQGNRYFDTNTLLERVAVKPATLIRYRQGRYSDELLEGDRAALLELYRANGFLSASITTNVNRQHKGRNDLVSITFNIDEGPQTRIAAVRIEGIGEQDQDYVSSLIETAPGQPYSLLTINADRDRLLDLFYRNGYSEASLEIKAAPGDQPNSSTITYAIKPGLRHFVRDVIVTGLKDTNTSLVGKRIRLTPGDPLNNTEIFASQRRLYDLGIFARVDTAQQNPDGREISKIVLFNLEEASRYSFNGGLGAEIARIGGGIASFASPAGGAGFSPRVSLGVNRTNFWGLGHTVGLQTRLSNIQRRVLLSYLAPQFRDSDRFSLTTTALYDDARNVRTFNSRRLESSLQLAQRINLANSLQYRFTFRRVTLDEATLKVAPALIPLLAQPVRVGSFSSTFIQDRRDDPVDAKRGRYTTIDFGVASGAFGSSANFLRLLTRNSSYYKLGRDLVFARSINFGVLTPYRAAGLTSQTDIPLPERFFAGGAYSHRGFPENQAGPRDLVTGFPIGGKALLVNNIELRFPLIGDNLGGVFFHDAGNVFSSLRHIHFRWNQRSFDDFDYMVHSIGFGVRYRTPIGPVRIDLALSPNSPRFNGFEGTREDLLFNRGRAASLRLNQFQFHISLGQAF